MTVEIKQEYFNNTPCECFPHCQDDLNRVHLECKHVYHTSCLGNEIWRQTGCDIEGESGTAACPVCSLPFEFSVTKSPNTGLSTE